MEVSPTAVNAVPRRRAVNAADHRTPPPPAERRRQKP